MQELMQTGQMSQQDFEQLKQQAQQFLNFFR
nr:MAG TPA: circadian clock protein [Caudoviricetes sp.]